MSTELTAQAEAIKKFERLLGDALFDGTDWRLGLSVVNTSVRPIARWNRNQHPT